MMRYSIIVTEYGSERAVELVQVNNNPQAIVNGLRQKMLLDPGRRRVPIPRYTFIEVVDRGAGK
jgi:hypothetical protein